MNPADDHPSETATAPMKASRRLLILGSVVVVTALATVGVTALLITIFEHKQEARTPFVRVVEVSEVTTDPTPWGMNWPRQFDSYQRTVDVTHTRYGGSSAIPEQKLDASSWLRRLYAGYAFSIDYRERRGHAYMLYDQEHTERVLKKPQTGACLHCHASIIPTYRRLGLEAEGRPADAAALAADFNWPAVMNGFAAASALTYSQGHAELLKTPDKVDPHAVAAGKAHPVSCVDCHDPATMQIRVTRPGFMIGVAALAKSTDPVPHLQSIERWRAGDRRRDYDPNLDASRQEMRSFVCGQCHVEYYCGSKETLFFPWKNGLKVEQIESTYEGHRFPDGSQFVDFIHGETGAPTFKAQHPEFELWNQGVHARSGVSCADCHMPYRREGAMKVSSHWVRSPLLDVNAACQTCHNVRETELLDKAQTIQDRTKHLMERSARAMTDMLDAIREAKAAGASNEQLAPILDLQRKATWRLDFISSENSMGFHASQESARILGESIDYSRQAQAAALRLRSKPTPKLSPPKDTIEGVTPATPPHDRPLETKK